MRYPLVLIQKLSNLSLTSINIKKTHLCLGPYKYTFNSLNTKTKYVRTNWTSRPIIILNLIYIWLRFLRNAGDIFRRKKEIAIRRNGPYQHKPYKFSYLTSRKLWIFLIHKTQFGYQRYTTNIFLPRINQSC